MRNTAWSPSIAARSRAARALRTAFEALVFGDFIMVVSRQPLALVWGLNSAAARSVRRLGASVRICSSDAALRQPLCAHAVHSGGGLGWVCRFPVFRLEGVWGSSRRCVRHSGGVRAGEPRSLRDCSQVSSSESLLLDLLAARIGVYEENERHSSPHAVLVGPAGCCAW